MSIPSTLETPETSTSPMLTGAPAARIGDAFSCAGGAPHGALQPPGIPTVLIAGAPAAVAGTSCICTMPPVGATVPTTVIGGSTSVLIGGKPAARAGDRLSSGGGIVTGCTSVLIGG